MARAEAASASARSGFHQGLGAIDRQAGLSAAAHRRAGAAPRGPGPDHRLPAHHRRRRRGRRCSTIAARRSPKPTDDIDDVADCRRRALRPAGRRPKPATPARARPARTRAARPRATALGRRILLSNAERHRSSRPQPAPAARSAASSSTCSATTQPLTILGASAGVLEITLADGSRALRDRAHARSRRSASSPSSSRRSDALGAWRSDTTLTVTLLGHHRLRAADPRLRLPLAGDARARSRPASTTPCAAASTPRSTAAAAACGTGTSRAAASSGRIRCSRSSASTPQDELLTFGEVSALVHPDDIKLYELADAARRRQGQRHRSRIPHAPRQRQLGLAARALRAGAPARRAGPAPDRHRGRHHRAEDAWSSRPPPPTCGCATRSRPSRKPSCCGTPTTAWCCATRTSRACTTCPTRRSPPARPTRTSSPAGRKHVIRTKLAERGPRGARRAHLRGAARRRPLAADQRAAHQGRRLRLGRHRHHRAQAARGEADRQRAAADGDRRRPAQLAADARAPDPAARRPGREIRRGEDPRRGGQPGQVEVPRQHEPRAAHAAQRHHRLLRDHGIGNVRPARRRQVSRILPRHPRERALSARRHQRHPRHVEDRGRPHQARPRRTSSSTASWPTPCAWSRRARRTSSSRSRREIAPGIQLAGRPARAQADRAQPSVQRGEVHARRRPHHGARPRCRAAPSSSRSRTPASASRATRCRSSAGRSSRSRASSPRPTTARASASPSPSRWSSCMAAPCASARRSAPARSWWCACRSTAQPAEQDKGAEKFGLRERRHRTVGRIGARLATGADRCRRGRSGRAVRAESRRGACRNRVRP